MADVVCVCVSGESCGVKWLIDTTIAYSDSKPLDLFCILFGHRAPCQTVIHHRKHLVADIPLDTDGLTAWLYDRYEEKEKMLAEFYATGAFPADCRDSRREVLLRVDDSFAWGLQGLFLISSIFHCYLIYLIVHVFYMLTSLIF